MLWWTCRYFFIRYYVVRGNDFENSFLLFNFDFVIQIIGRVQADPDYLPRTQDFGLNVHLFNQKYCSKDCPKQFIAIAIACCDINPESRFFFSLLFLRSTSNFLTFYNSFRPAFCVSHPWLEALALSIETGVCLSSNSHSNPPDRWSTVIRTNVIDIISDCISVQICFF